MTADPLWSYILLALLVVVAGVALLPFLRWRSAVKQNRLLEELLESQRRTNRMLERLAAGRELDPDDFEPREPRTPRGGAEKGADENDPPEEKDPWPPSTGSR